MVQGKRMKELKQYYDERFEDNRVSVNEQKAHYRFKWVLDRISSKDSIIPGDEGKILDLGVGNGTLLRMLKENGYDNLSGLDVSEKAINNAKKLVPSVDFVNEKASDMSFDDESFDAVIGLEILEHVEKPQEVLKEVFRVLKDDGTALFSVPYKQCFDCEEHLHYFHFFDLYDLFKQFTDNFKIYRIYKFGGSEVLMRKRQGRGGRRLFAIEVNGDE